MIENMGKCYDNAEGGREEGSVRAGLRESRAWLEEIWSKLPLPSPATCC